MRTLVGILILGSLISTFGQEYQHTIRNYKAIDGLPQSQVNIMLEDRNGYLWIGTQGGGLARFDGREFKVYTTLDGLLSNIITFLKLDAHDNLWIVHPRGITKYNGVEFKKFIQPGSPLNFRRMRKIFEFQDSLFFTSGQGEIGKIFNDSVYYWSKKVKPGQFIRYSHVDPSKNILHYISDSSFFIRTAKGDYILDHKEYFNRLLGMFNYEAKAWLKTDQGYFVVNHLSRQLEKRDLPIVNHVVFYDTLNDLFWTRHQNALLKEKITGGKVQIDTAMRDIEVTQVLADSEGNTWFASAGTGLFKYFIQDFDRCSSEKLKGVSAILKDRGGASWIGSTSRGLWKIDHGKISSYVFKHDAYRNMVNCIRQSIDGTVWVGTAYGLGRYNESKDLFDWFTRDDGLSNAAVVTLDFDEKNNLWIGTFSGGVNYYDGKSFRVYTVKDGLSSNTVNAIRYFPPTKEIFVGNEFGVASISGNGIKPISISGLENASVTSINLFRDSLIVVGSGGAGFAILNPKSGEQKVVTTRQGLTSDFIYFIAPDTDDYLWIGSEKGITRVLLNDSNDIEENLHYDYDNGLTGVETNMNAYFLGDGQNKYFGLIDGLYQFNDLPHAAIRSFGLHLTDVQLSFGEYDIRDYAESVSGFFKIPVNPVLPPDRNHISFSFNRVDKHYPKSVKFKYFLENFDQSWSPPSSSTQVTYSNLPPGKYVFRVMSTDNQGSWSPATNYPFTVRTPFYQTASFLVGMFVLFVGAVILTMYIRVKKRVNQVMMLERIRVKEQENLRREIARDFHDEMGNQLTRIINYVSLLKLNGNGNVTSNGNGHDLYTKVEDSAKYLYTGTRDFIWSIDPGNDELSKLFIHIRDFGEKLFEEKSISFRAFNEVKDKVKLPYGFSREANLIFKEAMTNAFKYSEAKNVSLTLNRDGEDFQMSFEDDGVGFYTGDIQKSNGLKNIRERADRIHAVLRIQSGKNQGTKVVLNFKLNKTLKYGLAL